MNTLSTRRRFLLGATAIGAGALAGPALAQVPPAPPPTVEQRVARLLARTQRAEALRAVKRLQNAYAHYALFGMWTEAAALFAADALVRDLSGATVGREAILARLQASLGNGGDGLAPGQLNIPMPMSPVVNVSMDGGRAFGRWHEVAMRGRYGETAEWAGGVYENEYVLEDGVWKIGFLNYYGRFAGPYEDGWRNTVNGAELVPFHYDMRGAGEPIPALPADLPPAEGDVVVLGAMIGSAITRLQRLHDEALVQNLQNAYGFYVDRKMWDDVADLFADDGVMESGNEGAYVGKASIRRGLDRFGAALETGQLNDHAQTQIVVTLSEDGRQANARGIDLGMTGLNGADGAWSVAVFENAYVKDNGVWRIAAMRLYPVMAADYALGWAKDAQAPAGPSADFPPDRAPAHMLAAYPDALAVPPFSFEDAGAVQPVGRAAPPPNIDSALARAERMLAVAVAYDGSENVCNAYGYYIDEFQWDETADIFSEGGWKELSYVGAYVGREDVRASLKKRYGLGGRGSPGMTLHQKIQPVIHVAEDGQSAKVRERLLQMNSSPANAGSYIGGIYENETVLENGVWKIAGMDLDYVWLGNYSGGWTRVDAAANARFAPPQSFLDELPPQRPLRGVVFAPFPEIAPMGFHYTNPVSGRVPEVLLPPDGAPL